MYSREDAVTEWTEPNKLKELSANDRESTKRLSSTPLSICNEQLPTGSQQSQSLGLRSAACPSQYYEIGPRQIRKRTSNEWRPPGRCLRAAAVTLQRDDIATALACEALARTRLYPMSQDAQPKRNSNLAFERIRGSYPIRAAKTPIGRMVSRWCLVVDREDHAVAASPPRSTSISTLIQTLSTYCTIVANGRIIPILITLA